MAFEEIGSINWPNLLDYVKRKYSSNENLIINYIDDENEEITLNSQIELDNAFEIISHLSSKLKILIKDKERKIVVGKYLIQNSHLLNEKKVIEGSSLDSKITGCSSLDSKMNENSAEISSMAFAKEFNQFKDEVLKMLNIFDQRLILLANKIDTLKISNNASNQANTLYEIASAAIAANNKLKEDRVEEKECADNVQSLEILTKTLLNELEQFKDSLIKSNTIRDQLIHLNSFNASFVRDGNIPDGTKLKPNTVFKKSWLLQNSGNLNWKEQQVMLVNTGGNINCEIKNICLNKVEVNETVEVEVELIAPNDAGTYYSEWVLMCRSFVFGPRVWCEIEVGDMILNISDNQKLVRQESCVAEENEDKESISSDIDVYYNLTNKEDYLNLSDDEFVIIPDCFDLTKEWKKQQSPIFPSTDNKEQNEFHFVDSFDNVNDTLENDQINVIPDEPHQQQLEQKVIFASAPPMEEAIKSEAIVKCESPRKEEIDLNEVLLREQEKFENSFKLASKPSILPSIQQQNHNYRQDWLNNKEKNETQCLNTLLANKQKLPSLAEQLSTVNETFNLKIDTPMNRLVSMGFANRNLNKKLLSKHNDDIEKVVEDLITRQDNNWA